jgi:hypothetical protein
MVHSRAIKTEFSIFNEYVDYIEALKVCSHETMSKYIAVFQDDALVESDFFELTRTLIHHKFPKNWIYFRPYFPLQWMGYGSHNLDEQLPFILLGAVLGSILTYSWIFSVTRDAKHAFSSKGLSFLVTSASCGGIWAFICLRALGRLQILHLRVRNSGYRGYNIIKADDCCIPAAVYRADHVPGLLAFLEASLQQGRFNASTIPPIDLMIAEYVHQSIPSSFPVGIEPNIVNHIGQVSSLGHTFVG